MTVLYMLDGERNVVPAADPVAWADWAAVWANRHVASAFLDEAGVVLLEVGAGEVVEPPAAFAIEVSTIFVGIRSHPTQEPPHLFETTVFYAYGTGGSTRYASWREAVHGHVQEVRLMRLELRGRS